MGAGWAMDATWETADSLRRNFPAFDLGDKVNVEGRTIVTVKEGPDDQVSQMGTEEEPVKQQTRRANRTNRQLTRETRYKDFIM